jgi:hypothetical protein
MVLNPKSIKAIMAAMITVEIITIMALLWSSSQLGQVTLCTSSLYDSLYFHKISGFCTGGATRTPDTWFWRPVLYQLSYTRIDKDKFGTQCCSGTNLSEDNIEHSTIRQFQ